MAEENITTSTDLYAQSIDFVEQFNGSVQKLLQIMGITRLTPMSVGSQIKIYSNKVTKGSKAAEGETIPLSKVERKLSTTLTLAFDKYRKQVTAEAIQSSGFQAAVTDTDSKLLREVQKDIKQNFLNFVATGSTNATGTNFQSTLGNVLGQLAVKWEDDDIQSVAFVNPIDFYAYLGGADITVQTGFGLQYIQNFMGFNTVILTSYQKQGTVAATASENINYAYASAAGALGQAFSLTTDETGLIGITHSPKTENASYETLVIDAGVLFPERLDGIVVGTIVSGSSSTTNPSNG